MTQEEKQILLKDLCARLLYGVKLNFYSAATKENYTCTLLGIEPNDDKSIIAKVDSGAFMFPAEHIKPYLRPMSSMTEEEYKEYDRAADLDVADSSETLKENLKAKSRVRVSKWYHGTDWLNEHHFDYRCLIEKGLALEAPEGMYKQ